MKYALKVQPAGAEGEDRAEVVVVGDTTVGIVADGAGGMGGGAEAADQAVRYVADQVRQAEILVPSTAAGWIEDMDNQLSRSPSGGQCTVLIVVASPEAVFGASVGDSEAWLIGENVDVLTEAQVRKPLVGSGLARATVFEREGPSGLLVAGTDGLFKYVRRDAIIAQCRRDPIDKLVETLVALAKLPTGGWQDDISVVVVDCGDATPANP